MEILKEEEAMQRVSTLKTVMVNKNLRLLMSYHLYSECVIQKTFGNNQNSKKQLWKEGGVHFISMLVLENQQKIAKK